MTDYDKYKARAAYLQKQVEADQRTEALRKFRVAQENANKNLPKKPLFSATEGLLLGLIIGSVIASIISLVS